MPHYRYTATRPDGSQVSGIVLAETEDAVRLSLQNDDLTVVTVELTEAEDQVAESAPAAVQQPGPSLSAGDAARLVGDISEIMYAGLPLVDGLRAMQLELPRGRYRSGLESVIRMLEQGSDLESVLESSRAPDDLLAMLRAAHSSGRPVEVLEQYLNRVRTQATFRHHLAMAMAYPAFLMLAVLAIVIFLLTWIVPQFRDIFRDFGLDLPGATLFLMETSQLLVEDWPLVLVVLVLGCVATFSICRYGLSPLTRRTYLWKLPLIGTRVRWLSLAQFSHVLSILVQQKIALPEALELAGTSTNDACVEQAARNMAESVRHGNSIADSEFRLRDFPASFLALLTSSERDSLLPEALRDLGMAFEGRARAQTPLLPLLFEPLFVVIAGFLVGFVVLALFSPLISLVNNLS